MSTYKHCSARSSIYRACFTHKRSLRQTEPSWQRPLTLRRTPWLPAVWYQQTSTSPRGRSTFDHSLEHPLPRAHLSPTLRWLMNSAPPVSPTVTRSTRTKDNGRDHSANAASALATAGPELTRSLSVQRHEPAKNPAAAALQAAADAAAIAAKRNDHEVLRAVLRAAATTANALAQAAPQDMVPTHRRGGRPPPTRRKPRAWPRRTQRPAGPGTPAPTATGISTAKLPKLPRWTQHPTTASSPPRDGRKARQQTGASTASSDRAASSTSTSATRNVPPKVEPTVMRLNGRD